MGRATLVLAAAAAFALGAWSCSAITGVGNLVEVGPDASGLDGSGDAGPADAFDASVESAADMTADTRVPLDAHAEAGADAADSGPVPDAPPPCPGTGGPVGINVGGYCIDSTEVTNAQYASFLAATDGGVPVAALLGTDCGWKTTFQPSVPPPNAGNFPVVYVDWCDAWAFCRWAGKRLCGAIDGGSLDPGYLDVPASDQWYSACSSKGAYTYPYATGFNPSACNGPDLDAGGAVAVGSLPACQGGYPGIFDMVGNVDEWVDSCYAGSGVDGGQDTCMRRSGSFEDPPAVMQTCNFYRSNPRDFADLDQGIRCCSNP